MLFLILLFYMEEFIFYSKAYLEKAYIVTFVWQFFHVSNYWKCSNKHQRSYRCILCVYPCIFSGARGQKRMNSSDSSPVHIHELSNSVSFLNFKTSLVITPPPASVILMHCVQKSICDSPPIISFLKQKKG